MLFKKYVRNVKILILKKEVMKLECCGVREFVFEEKIHVPVVDALCEFIVSQENSVWIAHNGVVLIQFLFLNIY